MEYVSETDKSIHIPFQERGSGNGMQTLRELVDTAISVQELDRYFPDMKYDAANEFADNPYVVVGLHTPEEAHETLELIDSLLSINATCVRDQTIARTARHRIAGMVLYGQQEIVAQLANGTDETAQLAQRVIFKTWCERAETNTFDADIEEQCFDILCQNLPEIIRDARESIPESAWTENIKRFSDRIFRLSGTEQAGKVLSALAQTIASPETQDVGEAMLRCVVDYTGEAIPDNLEELAYKIHVTNMFDKMDRHTALEPDAARVLLTHLETVGQANGWDPTLFWNNMTRYAVRSGLSLNDREFLGPMLLTHYGLDYDKLRDAWSVGSGYAENDRRFAAHLNENLKRIVGLEQQCPGAARKLNAPPYRIRNFARVPLEVLVAQANALGKQGLSYALVGLGIYENPSEPDNQRWPAHSPEVELPLWHNLYKTAAKSGITLFFHEGDGAQLVNVLSTALRRYGQPAEFAIGKFHNGDAPAIGSSLAARDRPTQGDIARLARGTRLREHLRGAVKRYGEVALFACYAGQPGNTAENLHMVTRRTVVGPELATNGFVDDEVALIPDRRGGHRLDFKYRNTDGTVVPARRYTSAGG